MTRPAIPFPSSASGAENIAVIRGGKRTRRNALIDVANVTSRPLPQSATQKSPAACKSPPRITILTNPERTRTRSLPPPVETYPSPIFEAPTPCITILTNPARTRSLPSIQNTPLPSSCQTPSPSRITILTNPARKRPSPTTENSQKPQNGSAAGLGSKRVPSPISILKALAPSKLACPIRSLVPSTNKPATETTNGKPKQKAEPLPEIVVHEPCLWDLWIDVYQPGMSHGELLDVPAVNWRGKLNEEDFARFYPKEHAAEQTMLRLRKMMRSGSRQAAAHRKERARKRRLAASSSSSTPPPIIPVLSDSAPITQTAGDSDAPVCSSPKATACPST